MNETTWNAPFVNCSIFLKLPSLLYQASLSLEISYFSIRGVNAYFKMFFFVFVWVGVFKFRYRVFMPLAKIAAKAEKLAKTPPHVSASQVTSTNPILRLFPRLAAIDFKSKAGQLRAAGNALVAKQSGSNGGAGVEEGGNGGGGDVEGGLVVADGGGGEDGGENNTNNNIVARDGPLLSRRQRVWRGVCACCGVCCGVCWRVCCKPSPSTALWLEHKKNALPSVPKSKVH